MLRAANQLTFKQMQTILKIRGKEWNKPISLWKKINFNKDKKLAFVDLKLCVIYSIIILQKKKKTFYDTSRLTASR